MRSPYFPSIPLLLFCTPIFLVLIGMSRILRKELSLAKKAMPAQYYLSTGADVPVIVDRKAFSSSILEHGFPFDILDKKYFARRALELDRIKLPSQLTGLATVIVVTDGKVTYQDLSDNIQQFRVTDDVFDTEFLQNILFVRSNVEEEVAIDAQARELLNKWGSEVTFMHPNSENLTQGPFLIRDGALHHVWRLFADPQDAYFLATIPTAANRMLYRPFQISDGHSPYIAVPSRLYFPRSTQKPLNGLRISIKDNMDLNGVKTVLSVRAWGDIYGEKNSTAVAVGKLLDLGAIVVAKSRLSQFAETEYPTADWVDYHCPFNPRGDGYLTPEGSSSGAAAALAAYDYLDASLATDTGGSIREPAAKQGLFGIRPTFGSISLDGVFPLARSMDTFGFMTRDIKTLAEMTRVMLHNESVKETYVPTKIICISTYDYKSKNAQAPFEVFMRALEKHLGFSRTVIDLFEVWNEDDPTKEGKSIIEYLGKSKTMAAIKNLDLWQQTQDFRDKYHERFGRPPYVNPPIRPKWESGRATTHEDHQDALRRQKLFKSWFEKSILDVGSNENTRPLVVLPLSDEEPEYRDDYADGPWVGGTGFHRNFISSLTGCPEILIPIGQIPYESRVSNRLEFMPSVASFLGPKGSDSAIANFAEQFLNDMHLATSVRTGSMAFEVAKNNL